MNLDGIILIVGGRYWKLFLLISGGMMMWYSRIRLVVKWKHLSASSMIQSGMTSTGSFCTDTWSDWRTRMLFAERISAFYSVWDLRCPLVLKQKAYALDFNAISQIPLVLYYSSHQWQQTLYKIENSLSLISVYTFFVSCLFGFHRFSDIKDGKCWFSCEGRSKHRGGSQMPWQGETTVLASRHSSWQCRRMTSSAVSCSRLCSRIRKVGHLSIELSVAAWSRSAWRTSTSTTAWIWVCAAFPVQKGHHFLLSITA